MGNKHIKMKHARLNKGLTEFVADFDTWTEVATSDPVKFESHRQYLIDDFFSNIPESRMRRLRGIQFQVDMERERAKTPMAACIKISSMMWDSIGGEGGLMDAFKALTHGAELKTPARSFKADLLKFSRNQTNSLQ